MVMVGVASGSLQAAYRRTHSSQPGSIWPGLTVSGRLVPFHIHHTNRVNSSGFRYDDSTIKHYHPHYYYSYY